MNSGEKSVDYFTPQSRPYGLSYGQWTVRWWQWLASIPSEANPAIDSTGTNSSENQIDPYVWFLAGTVGGKKALRKSTCSPGKSILFPVINYEINPLEKPNLRTKSEMIKHVKEDEDDIINLEARIDGLPIPIFRVASDPPFFILNIVKNNTLDVKGGGITQATADGYWVFLKSLPVGEHEIYFSGSCSAGSRNVEVTHNLTVGS